MSRRSLALPPAVALAATPLALWAVLASHHPAGPKLALATFGVLIATAFVASGTVARARRPGNATGALMIAVGFGWYLSALSQANNAYVFSVGSLVGALSFGFLVHLVLAFPSGRLETAAARRIVVAGYAVVGGVNVVSVLFSDLHASCGPHCPRNVLLLHHDEGAARALIGVFAASGVAVAIALVAELGRRWRRASAAMRRALLPVFVAGGATLAAAAVDLAASSISGSEHATYWLLLSVFVSVPLAFLFGLLRERMAGGAVARVLASEPTESSLREALHDPTLRLGFWYPERSGYVDADGEPLELASGEGLHLTELRDDAGVPIAAVLHDVALLEEPRRLMSVLAAARLGLERVTLQAALRARVADLRRERDFFSTVANVIPTLLVGVERDGRVHPRGGNRAFEDGTGYPDDDAVGRPLWGLVGAEDDLRAGIAEAVESNASSAERESTWRSREGREITVLWTCTPLPHSADEAPIYAVAALDITARKAAEIQLKRSRSRLVAAAASERRRLERNLHDGAQQRLVSVSLTMRVAQAKLESDPSASSILLDDAAHELALALEELRELARGLHPALLSERGLAAAVEALAERSPLPVEIEIELASRLPEPIEVAIFYVVSESLTNVAKYAHARQASVRIRAEGSRVVAEIEDDGVGGADIANGTGLRGLADRVEALDGTLTVDSPHDGGTVVTAVVPLAS